MCNGQCGTAEHGVHTECVLPYAIGQHVVCFFWLLILRSWFFFLDQRETALTSPHRRSCSSCTAAPLGFDRSGAGQYDGSMLMYTVDSCTTQYMAHGSRLLSLTNSTVV